MARPGGMLASPRLRRLAQGGSSSADGPAPEERCELCGEPIAPEHRHLLDLDSRQLMCACRACSTLFDRGAAGGGHYRLVPDRRLRVVDFRLTDLAWEELRIPVEMAFFFRNSSEDRMMAFYPSPMGATESLLGLEPWEQIESANPVLGLMEHDVEALLVNRARGARQHWIVSIEDCYGLVGLIRTRWKGLSGGKEVWEEIAGFFEELERRSRPVRSDGREEKASAASASGGEE
jgi:hypothetical protein